MFDIFQKLEGRRIARESLYRSLSQGSNPSFDTVVKVLDNLGYQLSVRQKVPA
jgi:probable addiction module antidote protein